MSRPRASSALLVAWLGGLSIPPGVAAPDVRAPRIETVADDVLREERGWHEETRPVTVGPEYGAGGWFRMLFGDGYRDLWTTPLRVPVLDLEEHGGGLRPVREIGGLQTLGLAFEGSDGRAYTFRSLHKHPERILPAEWRERFPGFLVQDATARTHPAAALVLSELAEAAGVAHTRPRLVVLPDDASLGSFRERFANEIGTIEEYPVASRGGSPGFMGATRILSTRDLWALWMDGPDGRVDSRAYLRARLLDLFVDNYDRHGGQWRWMKLPGYPGLQPLPEDPDMALVHHDGLVMSGVRNYNPRLLRFDTEYSKRLDGPLVNAFALDRWLLADLDSRDFEKLARDLQRLFTNEVIEGALDAMPPEWRGAGARDTFSVLVARREKLVEYARRVYLYYARDVDIHATDRAESVTVKRLEDDSLEVTLSSSGGPGPPYYERRFLPSETREVRLYLHGGNDGVGRGGPPGGPIRVRVISGGGSKLIDDSASGGTDVWVDEGSADVRPGPGTHLRDHRWVNPEPRDDAPWVQPRSWGHWTVPRAIVGWGPDVDLVVGGGFARTSWGFRNHPERSVQTLGAAYATGSRSGKVAYTGAYRPSASRLSLGLQGFASGIEQINFFGFGNDTAPVSDRSRYRSDETQVLLGPTLSHETEGRLVAFVGADVRYSDSPADAGSGTILGEEAPYGTGGFGSLTARAGLRLDTRDRHPASFVEGRFVPPGEQHVGGVRLDLAAQYVAEAWDAVEAYGAAEGEVAGYLGGSRAHLALRLGGRRVWGSFPWFDAAFLGGRNARAYRPNRFAGDRLLYGSVELRLWLAHLANPVIPIRFGLFAFAETGRVWYEDDTSTTWHESYGGGGLFQPFGIPVTLHATVGHGEGETRFYFGSGYSF